MATTKPMGRDEPFELQIRRAVRKLQRMSLGEGIQLLVRSGELTQEEADAAIARLGDRAKARSLRAES